MFEANRRDVVGKTLMDYSKLLFASFLATGFFAAHLLKMRVGIGLLLVVIFAVGWWAVPPKKGDE